MLQGLVHHGLILLTILLISYAQLVFKWRASSLGQHELLSLKGVFSFFRQLGTDPWVLSAIIAAGAVLPVWLIVVNRFNISYAYPLLSLSFLIVPLGGICFFGERFHPLMAMGLLLIVFGVALTSFSRNLLH